MEKATDCCNTFKRLLKRMRVPKPRFKKCHQRLSKNRLKQWKDTEPR
jgi:hypothetical protein